MTTPIFTAKTAAYTTPTFPSQGDVVSLIAKGTWGGALVTVEVSPDDGTTWVTSQAQLTADGIVNFIAGRGTLYRVSLTNPNGTTNLSAWIAYAQ